jgi:type IV pilus assembly protein PilC
MKLYYRAVTQDGKIIRGLIESKDVEEAAVYLRKHKLIPIKIMEDDKMGFARYVPFLNRTTSSDVILFTRQLASMITSGLTLLQALKILTDQTQSVAMSKVLTDIIADIEDGKMFSAALSKYPRTFTPIYISLIKTAESSGLLDKILTRLAANLEKKDKLIRTIRGALLYPLIVIITMIVVTALLMIFVIPQLTSMYTSMNISLPLQTAIIIGISHFTIQYWYIALLLFVGFFFYFQYWYRKPAGRKMIDTYVLKLPLFGKLLQESKMAEFTRTLSILISSGSLVVESLNKSADVVGNVFYKEAILLVSLRVEKGISIGSAMEASPIFPPMVVQMVKIGEQTGKLDETLMKSSEYYEREVEETVKTMTTLLEPLIMVLLALGVGFLIFAIITPLYNLITNIS